MFLKEVFMESKIIIANHKGYPTKKHIEAIHKYGLIDGYRLTYGPVKEIVNNTI